MNRRDAQPDNEQIPLPIETVYNSLLDSLKVKGRYGMKYLTNGVEHFNRLYFNYPPEWKTSNIGEKIIGVRNMSVKLRNGELNFILYIRKYDYGIFNNMKDAFLRRNPEFNDISDTLFVKQIILENLENYTMNYIIPIRIKITSNNNWIDIKEQIINTINSKDLYYFIKTKIMDREIDAAERTVLLKDLEEIKGDYKTMIQRCDEFTGFKILFFLEPDDVEIIDTFENNQHNLIFRYNIKKQKQHQFYMDFAILNSTETYDKIQLPDDLCTIDENFELENVNGHTEDDYKVFAYLFEHFEDKLNDDNRFDLYTANFFNMDNNNPYKNDLNYIFRFHSPFVLKNIMTDLECEVVASFASQSNHNLIGRTNETYEPIKYYKLNDNDDKFWIEFYDKNEIKIPITLNDNVVFTIDMVFLQNRKLLYS